MDNTHVSTYGVQFLIAFLLPVLSTELMISIAEHESVRVCNEPLRSG